MKLTIQEAARVIGESLGRTFSVHTVYTWVKSGKIPVVKVGRAVFIEDKDLEKFLSSSGK